MAASATVNNVRLFASFARGGIRVWRGAIGCDVRHSVLGDGKIIDVIVNDSALRVHVIFSRDSPDHGARKFETSAFDGSRFYDMTLPSGLMAQLESYSRELLAAEVARAKREEELARLAAEEEERQRRREGEARRQADAERDARQHFSDLKAKYGVATYRDNSPSSLLYVILLKLDSDEDLVASDIAWLAQRRLHRVSATYYQRVYDRTLDIWNLIRASRYWRQAGEPVEALKTTDWTDHNDSQVESARLTTRGGAFRDLGQLTKAMNCAEEASERDPTSWRPHNLIGALYYRTGHPEDGDRHFQIAIDLGAPVANQDLEIQSAVKNAGENEQKRAAVYLLSKDPVRYSWARHYLN